MTDKKGRSGGKTPAQEAYHNAFRGLTKEDEVQQMLGRIREVSKVGVSSRRFIQQRILAKDQFLDRQRQFFNLGEGQLERGLDAEQHKRVFNLAFDQAYQSFAPEDRQALDSVLAGKDSKAFTTMNANTRVAMLEQSLKEGRQSKLLIQLVNRGRRSLRPTARHFAAHYGSEAEVAHRFAGQFPETLAMNIPRLADEKSVISTRSLDVGWKEAVKQIGRSNQGLGSEFQKYLKGMKALDPKLGLHTGFELKQNTWVQANKGSGAAGQYHLKFSYDDRDVTLRIPIITGNNAKIGYTGDNLNVRRIMTPVGIVRTGQENMTHSVMQRNQFFLNRFNEEVLPLMQKGQITGRELRNYVEQLNQIFVSQEVSSGRTHTVGQSFFQTRYERERGAMMQMVTRNTGGFKMGNVPMAYSSLSDKEMLRFLNVRKDDFGIDISENRFAVQGVLATKTGQKTGGRAIVGDLTAHEFADPRVVEHARLDQKIRKRTMSAESVIAAYKGTNVQQREWQAYGSLKLGQKIEEWGKRWKIGFKQRDELKALALSKRLNFEDLDALKDEFEQHALQKDYTKMEGKKKFGLLSQALHTMDSRPDAAGVRQRFTNFLTPQELALYGMAEVDKNGNLKRHAVLDNKSMLPPGEARYEDFSPKRLARAREVIIGIQDIIHGKGIPKVKDAASPKDRAEGRKALQDEAFKKFFQQHAGADKQSIRDAGFLMSSTGQLPYYKKRHKSTISKQIGKQLGLQGGDLSSLIPRSGGEELERVRQMLAQREEVLQVGTMYVDPAKMGGKDALHATKYFGSGEGIMREKMKHLLTQETTMNKSLARLNPEAFELEKDTKIVGGEFKAGGFKKDSNGQYILKENRLKMRNSIIAWDSQGREVLYDKKMRNIQFSEMDANDGSSTKWLLMEYDELIRPESHVKLHGDIKQGVSFVKGGVKGWKAMAADLASMLTKGNIHGRYLLEVAGKDQTVEGITEMQFKHGRRSHQHIRQIATAMSMVMQDHVGKGFGAGDDELKRMAGAPIKGVVQSPVDFVREKFNLGKEYKGDRKQAHTDQVQKMLNWYMEKAMGTKEYGVHGKDTDAYLYDEKKFAKIFGLTGTVFGENEYDAQGKLVKEGLSERMIKEAFRVAAEKTGIAPASASTIQAYIDAGQSGAAYGVARQFLGDHMSMQGAGKMGTLEGRSMMIMTGHSFGERGEEMSMDFLKRMKAFDLGPEGSEKWRVREELQRSLKTIIEPTHIPKGAAVIDLTGKIESSQVIKKMAEQGQNALVTGQDVWLKTGANKGVYLPSMDLPGMAEKTIETGRGDIKASAVLRNQYTRFIQDVAGGVTPSEALGDLQDAILPHSVEFSKKGMGGVLKGSLPGSRSLVASSRSSSEEIMQRANVVGISKKNVQRMVKEMVDTDLYDEKQVAQIQAFATRLEAGETVGGTITRHPFIGSHSVQKTLFQIVDEADDVIVMPEIAVDIGKGDSRTRLKLGAMLGLAGDYDFDTIIASFVDPLSEQTIAREMDFSRSSDYYERYMQHQIRYQMLDVNKTGASTGTLSNTEDAAGKMQVKERYVGRLSNEMTKVKFAASSFIKNPERAANVFALTEWLEQKPISSKHLNPADLEVAMAKLLGTFEGGAKNWKDMHLALKSFIDEDSAKNIVLSQEDVAAIKKGTGYQIKAKANKLGQVVIKGFDLEQLSKDIFHAQTRARETGFNEKLQTFKGTTRGAAAAKSILELYGSATAGMGRAASVADQVLSNIMGAAGQSGILHHRGIQAAMALGSLAGLGSMLSQPKEMVGPGKHLDSRARMNMSKGTKRIKKDDVKPPRAPIGTPTSPSMLSQRRAMISAKPVETNHFVVRARAQYPEDVALISQQLQQFTSLGNSVNISVRDSRGIPNRYADSNKAY